MKVEYWGVGDSAPSALDMTIPDISTHLLMDWVPSLPVSVSSSFMGWPQYLTDLFSYKIGTTTNKHIILSEHAGQSERQWKSVLSWMLGVAGARHFLQKEGYKWIAPLSAFYPNLRQKVNLASWHPSFPSGAVVANGAAGSAVRLRPDYIALRQVSPTSPLEWAVAEAKGTNLCLTNKKNSPDQWKKQAHNVEIEVHGKAQKIPRHIVIATRVNPNAVQEITRRIQIRAWNSDEPPTERLNTAAVLDIVTAHLFGIFRNLHLTETARALAYSVQKREYARTGKKSSGSETTYNQLLESSIKELDNRQVGADGPSKASRVYGIDTDFGRVSVEIEQAVMDFTNILIRAEANDPLVEELAKIDDCLEGINANSEKRTREDAIELPTGVRVVFPKEIIDRFIKGSEK